MRHGTYFTLCSASPLSTGRNNASLVNTAKLSWFITIKLFSSFISRRRQMVSPISASLSELFYLFRIQFLLLLIRRTMPSLSSRQRLHCKVFSVKFLERTLFRSTKHLLMHAETFLKLLWIPFRRKMQHQHLNGAEMKDHGHFTTVALIRMLCMHV